MTSSRNPGTVSVSVLDTVPVFAGMTDREALCNTIELAVGVESLGYRRHWVAEHHNTEGVAVTAPAVLLAHLAQVTSTLRVGSGGVLLPNHPPLVVAEQFNTLAALHPGRLDLGIGRAPGTDPMTAFALRRKSVPNAGEEYARMVTELLDYLYPPAPPGPGTIQAFPESDQPAQVWLLGSSPASATLAGTLGLPLAFARHLNPEAMTDSLAAYREAFRPSRFLTAPYVLVSILAIVADTDDEAVWLAGPPTLHVVETVTTGRPARYRSPEAAAAHDYTEFERRILADRVSAQAVGSPQTVAARLAALLTNSGADELMAFTPIADPKKRLRSYQLLADAAAAAASRGCR